MSFNPLNISRLFAESLFNLNELSVGGSVGVCL